MATSEQNLSSYSLNELPDGSDFKVGVVASEWNVEICKSLLDGAVSVLKEKGVSEDKLHIIRVPGSFELPFAASMLLKAHSLDGVLCLGCVIKGETRHDEYINQSIANGITQLSILSGKPVVYGVITAENKEQALDRSGGKHGNKGVEGAVTLLKMIDLKKDLSQAKGKNIGF